MSQDAGDDAIISVRDLVAGFDGQTVLNHLDLDVRSGEISAWSAGRAPASPCSCARSSG